MVRVTQSEPRENALARGATGAAIDHCTATLSATFRNQPLCFELLMLKMLSERVMALDPEAGALMLSGVMSEALGGPSSYKEAAQDLQRQAWPRLAAADLKRRGAKS